MKKELKFDFLWLKFRIDLTRKQKLKGLGRSVEIQKYRRSKFKGLTSNLQKFRKEGRELINPNKKVEVNHEVDSLWFVSPLSIE